MNDTTQEAPSQCALRQRVKLYALNAERHWDDRGTGHVQFVNRCSTDNRSEADHENLYLFVRDENDGSELLNSPVRLDTSYQRQQETLIVWSENGSDLALSFQERNGCEDVWGRICKVQGKDPSVEVTQECGDDDDDELNSVGNNDVNGHLGGDSEPLLTTGSGLPFNVTAPIPMRPPTAANLETILRTVKSCMQSPVERERLSISLEQDNYITRLFDVFRQCESAEDIQALFCFYNITYNILILNKTALYDRVFADENIDVTLGALEYDPRLPSCERKRHRQIVLTHARFREVVPIPNAEIRSKIQQSYKVQYIHDILVPTPSVFEDNMLSALSSFLFFNKVDITSQLQEDDSFLQSLIDAVTRDATAHTKRDVFAFLKEYCTFSHTLQAQNRDLFYSAMVERGILRAIEVTMRTCKDAETRSLVLDVFSYLIEFGPQPLIRDYCLSQAHMGFPTVFRSQPMRQSSDAAISGSSKTASGAKIETDLEGERFEEQNYFLNVLITEVLSTGTDDDHDNIDINIVVQLMSVLRVLLDPESMTPVSTNQQPGNSKTEFLAFFYRHCIHHLLQPLMLHIEPSCERHQKVPIASQNVDPIRAPTANVNESVKRCALKMENENAELSSEDADHAYGRSKRFCSLLRTPGGISETYECLPDSNTPKDTNEQLIAKEQIDAELVACARSKMNSLQSFLRNRSAQVAYPVTRKLNNGRTLANTRNGENSDRQQPTNGIDIALGLSRSGSIEITQNDLLPAADSSKCVTQRPPTLASQSPMQEPQQCEIVPQLITAQLLNHIVELISFCIDHHPLYIKNYIITTNLIGKVLMLLRSRHMFLVCTALRALRKVVGSNNEFYNRYIEREDLFKPVIERFNANGSRYNLYNSAVLELFEHVRQDDNETLGAYLLDCYGEQLQSINYVKTFQDFNKFEKQRFKRKRGANIADEEWENVEEDDDESIDHEVQDEDDDEEGEEEELEDDDEDEEDEVENLVHGQTMVTHVSRASTSTAELSMSPNLIKFGLKQQSKVIQRSSGPLVNALFKQKNSVYNHSPMRLSSFAKEPFKPRIQPRPAKRYRSDQAPQRRKFNANKLMGPNNNTFADHDDETTRQKVNDADAVKKIDFVHSSQKNGTIINSLPAVDNYVDAAKVGFTDTPDENGSLISSNTSAAHNYVTDAVAKIDSSDANGPVTNSQLPAVDKVVVDNAVTNFDFSNSSGRHDLTNNFDTLVVDNSAADATSEVDFADSCDGNDSKIISKLSDTANFVVDAATKIDFAEKNGLVINSELSAVGEDIVDAVLDTDSVVLPDKNGSIRNAQQATGDNHVVEHKSDDM